MRRGIFFLCGLLAAMPVAAFAGFFGDDAPVPAIAAPGVSFETAFSPAGALSPLVVKELSSAKKSVRVAARDFMSKPVSESLFHLTRAGMDVKVVLNRKTNSTGYSAAQFLFTMSCPPHLTRAADALHADYIVVDERDIILGNIAGFNDEEDEKKNMASVLVIHDAPDLAKQYLAHWQTLWDASDEMKKEKD
jgi:phosphatidylserine/phosphatidylglycerophosphate/cardiolipin synthase-like enzyme